MALSYSSAFGRGRADVALSLFYVIDGIHLINLKPNQIKTQTSYIVQVNKLRNLNRPDLVQLSLPNDMENYMEYHVMGSVSQVRMKPACMPSKFQCQPDRRKRTFNATKRPYILKKQRLTLIKECEKDLEERSVTTKQVEVGESSSGISVSQAHIENTSQKDSHKSADKATQVLITYKYRSKAIQTEVNLVNQMTSPLKPFNQSVSTSPFKIKSCITAKPSTSMIQKYSRKLFTIEEESDSDISFAPSSTHRESSPSTISQQMKSTSDCSELIEEDKKQEASKILEYTLLKITKNPRFYIGYGGRITDTCLVEQCDFIRCLQPGMYVMADRGFKHVEQYLRKEGVQEEMSPARRKEEKMLIKLYLGPLILTRARDIVVFVQISAAAAPEARGLLAAYVTGPTVVHTSWAAVLLV
ncbi:hypothetical protein EVAR_90148_1 [Eumeta japonica]|uniref:DDE Tnp4 domain-containing protein n=1 Tax=Eumeta variegata TaxID=151549 RepID=A0A4C1Z7T4_EUMVA|nr:hypothetical protein EVAR_90148_1 [Eumeta japonica]